MNFHKLDAEKKNGKIITSKALSFHIYSTTKFLFKELEPLEEVNGRKAKSKKLEQVIQIEEAKSRRNKQEQKHLLKKPSDCQWFPFSSCLTISFDLNWCGLRRIVSCFPSCPFYLIRRSVKEFTKDGLYTKELSFVLKNFAWPKLLRIFAESESFKRVDYPNFNKDLSINWTETPNWLNWQVWNKFDNFKFLE